MIEIGKIHALEIVKRVDFGLYLDGLDAGEILLPERYVPENAEIGDFLDVFIYLDHDERLIATTLKPLVCVGEFACLKVVDVNQVGAFLDWGVMKHLLLPYREQNRVLRVGDTAVVYVYIDEKSHRIVASTKIDNFIDTEYPNLAVNECVDLLLYKKTDLGYNAVINNRYSGLIYDNEIFKPLSIGVKTKGYIKNIRPDNKIDLSLTKCGVEKLTDLETIILDKLTLESSYFLPFTDKSDAHTIYSFFEMSKKNFKKAIGGLYKKQLIRIEEDGIRLVEKS